MYPTTGRVVGIEKTCPCGVVLVEPCRTFRKRELDLLTAYVRGGGRLLVLDSVLNERSTANEVLGRFGMMVHVDPYPGRLPCADVTPRLRIRGGEIIQGDESGNATVAGLKVDAGMVVVAIDSFRYSEYLLGAVLQKGKPSAAMRTIYGGACRLLQKVFLVDSILDG